MYSNEGITPKERSGYNDHMLISKEAKNTSNSSQNPNNNPKHISRSHKHKSIIQYHPKNSPSQGPQSKHSNPCKFSGKPSKS